MGTLVIERSMGVRSRHTDGLVRIALDADDVAGSFSTPRSQSSNPGGTESLVTIRVSCVAVLP